MIIEIFVFYVGACLGSFFYTVALRYASDMFSSSPFMALFSRSSCDNCKKNLDLISLIPIFGFLIIKGKCRSCGARVSPLYPLFEILYGILALLVYRLYGISILSLDIYLICSVSIIIAVVDVKKMIIPPSLVILFLIFSIYYIVLRNDYFDNLYGFLFLVLFFSIMLFIFPGAFGGGDLKLYAASGLLLGLEMSIVLLEVSLISGALFGIVYALLKGKNFRLKIPFAPFIAFGVIITLLFGNKILLYYYNMINF